MPPGIWDRVPAPARYRAAVSADSAPTLSLCAIDNRQYKRLRIWEIMEHYNGLSGEA